jgi:hypothetical protein
MSPLCISQLPHVRGSRSAHLWETIFLLSAAYFMSWVNVIAIKESDQKVRIDDRHGFESESFLILGFDGWSCTRLSSFVIINPITMHHAF